VAEAHPLTPWVPARREAARAAFLSAVEAWLGAASAGVAVLPIRRVSPGSSEPTTLRLTGPRGETLEMKLHRLPKGVAAAAGAWTAGRLRITVARPSDPRVLKTPAFRAVLSALAARVAADGGGAAGEALDALHHRWATLETLDDRMFRHIEVAHSGVTGLLRTGFTCNQDCAFCPEGRDWPNPSDDEIFGWFDEMVAAGIQRLTICGGEPTIWRRLPELLDKAGRQHGLPVHMNTNAIQLAKPGVAERLRDAGLESILVSLHAADEALSDAITRAPGTWKRTVVGIDRALDAGLFVILNCCVDTRNVDHLPDHARFIRDRYATRDHNPVRMVNYSAPGVGYNVDHYLETLVDYETATPKVTEAVTILGEVGVLMEVAGTCGFPSCVVREVTPFVPWRPRSTMDAHHRSARTEGPTPCQRCAVADQCIRPRREYLQVHGERGLVPYAEVPASDWYQRLAALPLAARWGTLDQLLEADPSNSGNLTLR
jgi:MoaA/NifB/PqqE/SkfB family radical SAM enzyme